MLRGHHGGHGNFTGNGRRGINQDGADVWRDLEIRNTRPRLGWLGLLSVNRRELSGHDTWMIATLMRQSRISHGTGINHDSSRSPHAVGKAARGRLARRCCITHRGRSELVLLTPGTAQLLKLCKQALATSNGFPTTVRRSLSCAGRRTARRSQSRMTTGYTHTV